MAVYDVTEQAAGAAAPVRFNFGRWVKHTNDSTREALISSRAVVDDGGVTQTLFELDVASEAGSNRAIHFYGGAAAAYCRVYEDDGSLDTGTELEIDASAGIADVVPFPDDPLKYLVALTDGEVVQIEAPATGTAAPSSTSIDTALNDAGKLGATFGQQNTKLFFPDPADASFFGMWNTTGGTTYLGSLTIAGGYQARDTDSRGSGETSQPDYAARQAEYPANGVDQYCIIDNAKYDVFRGTVSNSAASIDTKSNGSANNYGVFPTHGNVFMNRYYYASSQITAATAIRWNGTNWDKNNIYIRDQLWTRDHDGDEWTDDYSLLDSHVPELGAVRMKADTSRYGVLDFMSPYGMGFREDNHVFDDTTYFYNPRACFMRNQNYETAFFVASNSGNSAFRVYFKDNS